MKYDYLIVGAGLYGAVFAQMMTDNGRSCIVIDRRSHIGGNAHCDEVDGIVVHRYGPHIFHTSDQGVWEYVNRFAEFSGYVHASVANYSDSSTYVPEDSEYELQNIMVTSRKKVLIADTRIEVRFDADS
ncbi:MAG: NAD(P)-binding protein [Oscillospiraceae bacterium]|nr:NAD(P)-binding protein [Oscillospiraceae bacterium]